VSSSDDLGLEKKAASTALECPIKARSTDISTESGSSSANSGILEGTRCADGWSGSNGIDQQRTLVVLVSNGVNCRKQASRQRNTFNILAARRTPCDVVDGMDPKQRAVRDSLFEISGTRGNYPQFFVYNHHDYVTEFLGDYELIERLNETDALPEDVLVANPQLQTWETVFANFV